jgi:hypothetical protein
MKRLVLGLILGLLVSPLLTIANEAMPAYDRGEWRHWVTSTKKSCWTVRDEVLARDAKDGPFYHHPDDPCSTLMSGKWMRVYIEDGYDNLLTSTKEVDIDHMVPLKEAHRSGGWAWSKEKKQQYANFTTYRWHLLAVSASQNRSKGDKSPDKWQPPNAAVHCQYAHWWAAVRFVWDLSSTEPERATVLKMLSTCSGPMLPIQSAD